MIVKSNLLKQTDAERKAIAEKLLTTAGQNEVRQWVEGINKATPYKSGGKIKQLSATMAKAFWGAEKG